MVLPLCGLNSTKAYSSDPKFFFFDLYSLSLHYFFLDKCFKRSLKIISVDFQNVSHILMLFIIFSIFAMQMDFVACTSNIIACPFKYDL